jgi:5-methylcytosine-specific restriction endonuclease McrA
VIPHGPGALQPEGLVESWGGRKAQRYVDLTLSEYGRRCYLCGLAGADSADHVVPRSLGGAVFDLRNLGPSHRSCNYRRGNRPVEVFDTVESGIEFFSRA